jgi:signal transduction histidine kinase
MIEAEAADRLNAENRSYLARMKIAAARMDHLIVDVLSYSRIVRGELTLHPVNLSDLLGGIVETYPALSPFQAKIKVPPDLPLVQGNEAALTQCFSNLLDNAVKFVKPGQIPQINIKGEKDGGWIRIWVEDNGIGIPKTFQKQLFGMFQRGSNSQEGTGIGLAIVRKTVERMGGRVGVISEPDQGSRFWIELKSADSMEKVSCCNQE